MVNEDSNSSRSERTYTLPPIMDLNESLDMVAVRKDISKKLLMFEESEEVPGEVLSLLNTYRDAVEHLIDSLDVAARSRAMVGYLLLKAEAYREGGWLNHWGIALDEAEENAHFAQLGDEYDASLDLLWRYALLNVIRKHSTSSSMTDELLYESDSGEFITPLDDLDLVDLEGDELIGLAFTTLIEAGEDPEEYLTRFGLM